MENDEHPIKLLKRTKHVKGGLWFEFFPGKPEGRDLRPNDSSFIYEPYVYVLEPIFKKSIEKYSHYFFNEVGKEKWSEMLLEIKKLADTIDSIESESEAQKIINLVWQDTHDFFYGDFEVNKKALVKMINDFHDWIASTLEEEDQITIFGI